MVVTKSNQSRLDKLMSNTKPAAVAQSSKESAKDNEKLPEHYEDLTQDLKARLLAVNKPQGHEAWKMIVIQWINDFQRTFLHDFDGGMQLFARQMFLIEWRDTLSLQNPDIEGSLLHSILFSSKKFGCQCCPTASKLLAHVSTNQKEDFGGLSNVSGTQENIAIILEILKYYGRDFNVVEAYALFKSIHERYIEACKLVPAHMPVMAMVCDESQFKLWFLRALADLKFMGILSTTKQNTFIFKKNVFGKPKYTKTVSSTEQQKTEELVAR
jgi:hypothetical protein